MAPSATHSGIPFKFEIPVEVFEKAGEAGKEWRIGGIATTEHPDRQDEVVRQSGLDWSDFLDNGWFNDNHSRDTTGVLGYPSKVKATTYRGKPATYVEGYLLQDYDRAKEIYKLGKALQKTNRKLGFSVEGKITRREGVGGKIIAQARVSNIAITNCPVNTATGMEILAKSLQVAESADPTEWEKALAAGASVESPGAAPGEGFALRTESLESAPKAVTEPGKKKRKKKRPEARYLNKAQAMAAIRQRFGGDLSPGLIESVWLMAQTKPQE